MLGATDAIASTQPRNSLGVPTGLNGHRPSQEAGALVDRYEGELTEGQSTCTAGRLAR
jgi:hypothetical protein